jgi:hypothetical protein
MSKTFFNWWFYFSKDLQMRDKGIFGLGKDLKNILIWLKYFSIIHVDF